MPAAKSQQPTGAPDDAPRSVEESLSLGERQAAVLRALVRSFVGDAGPVGSKTLAQRLSLNVSPATIRTILAELTELRLVEKPHASAGRVPTELGLRFFVDELLAEAAEEPPSLDSCRHIDDSVAGAEGEGVVRIASQLLSEQTRQLGFVVPPPVDHLVLQHVSLVRLSAEKVLVVLVSRTGAAHRRVISEAQFRDQGELDHAATLLNERVRGRTLLEVRDALRLEAEALRDAADAMRLRALTLGVRALEAAEPEEEASRDLVIETRLALLDQPEFQDPRRLRELFETLETKRRLLDALDELVGHGALRGLSGREGEGVQVGLGEEFGPPGLRHCAVVATAYGGDGRSEGTRGVLGVIGPSRMNYSEVIPLVGYLSQVMTRKLCP